MLHMYSNAPPRTRFRPIARLIAFRIAENRVSGLAGTLVRGQAAFTLGSLVEHRCGKAPRAPLGSSHAPCSVRRHGGRGGAGASARMCSPGGALVLKICYNGATIAVRYDSPEPSRPWAKTFDEGSKYAGEDAFRELLYLFKKPPRIEGTDARELYVGEFSSDGQAIVVVTLFELSGKRNADEGRWTNPLEDKYRTQEFIPLTALFASEVDSNTAPPHFSGTEVRRHVLRRETFQLLLELVPGVEVFREIVGHTSSPVFAARLKKHPRTSRRAGSP